MTPTSTPNINSAVPTPCGNCTPSPTPRRPDDDWCWATQAGDALVAMQKLVAEAIAAGADAVDPDALAEPGPALPLRRPDRHHPDRGPLDTMMRKHNALARRLLDRQDDYLRFTTDWRIPADNNGSERDIRMIKLRQKVSGCLRTLTGAQQFCAIRSYLSTAAKHGRTLLRHPRHARRGPTLDARAPIITPPTT